MSRQPLESDSHDANNERVEIKLLCVDDRRLVVKKVKHDNGLIVYEGFDLANNRESVTLSEWPSSSNSDLAEMKQWSIDEFKKNFPQVDFDHQQGTSSSTFSLQNQSKLETEFEFVESLGSGGFGSVAKVKSKRGDEGVYAVKRIEIDSIVDVSDIKTEVKILAEMDHKNVVRYYYHWIEDNACDEFFGDTTSATDNTTSNEVIRLVILFD